MSIWIRTDIELELDEGEEASASHLSACVEAQVARMIADNNGIETGGIHRTGRYKLVQVDARPSP